MAVAGACTVVPPHLTRQCPAPAGTCASYCSTSNLATPSTSFRGRTVRVIRTLRSRDFSAVKKAGSARSPILATTQEASTSTCQALVAEAVLVQEVEFSWKGQGSEVLLTGDFLKWETKLALERRSDGTFFLKQKLAPGRYTYKFIVDGEWRHSPDSPTVSDGIGGFNNELIVTGQSPIEAPKDSADAPKTQALQNNNIPENSVAATKPSNESESTVAVGKPAAPTKKSDSTVAVGKPAAPAKKSESAVPVGNAAAPAKRAPKVVPKKAVEKSLKETMVEDVIPLLTSTLGKEAGLYDLSVTFEDNELKTSFAKADIPHSVWAFFPDGTIEGSRGFALTSHGSPPSTIEPFLVDEKKITPELIVFWIRKRLFAQKVLSMN